jgi:ABC-type glycerol-3-phosphate transport system substrate-binding protein
MLVNVTPVLTVKFYQNLVAPFEKANPNVKVVIEAPTSSTANVQDTLTQELAAGTQPDMLGGQAVPAEAKVMATFPKASWVSSTPMAQATQIDGRQWMVAASIQAQSLVFYNKTAFEKAGITQVPTTVSQLTADLKAIKAVGGYVPMDTAGQWVTSAQFQELASGAVMQDDPNWYSQRNTGKVSFAKSDYSTYMNVYKSWITDGLVPSDANGVNYNDSITAFTSGKAATYPMGNWMVPSIDSAKKNFQVGVFSAPGFNGKLVPQVGNPADDYAVLKSSQHQTQAFALAKFLVTNKAAVTAQLAAEGNFRAGYSYKASALSEDVSKIVNAAPGAVVSGDGFGANTAPTGYSAELSTLMQGMYLGDSASKVIKAIDSWWTTNETK